MDAVSDSDPLDFQVILANLSAEICRPLDRLQQGIESLLTQCDGSLTDNERSQAATMHTLCDELDRLTRVYLGNPGRE